MSVRPKDAIERALDIRDAQLNDVAIDPTTIRAIMINEVVPTNPLDDFYAHPNAEYAQSASFLFEKAGVPFASPRESLEVGIYLTNAIKWPKDASTVSKELIQRSVPILEQELALFPHVQVIMLMGDVAKKCFNAISKKRTGHNAVPSGSTYKLRATEIECEGVRIMPSYIMTGGNILIERSKIDMIADDIARMWKIVHP